MQDRDLWLFRNNLAQPVPKSPNYIFQYDVPQPNPYPDPVIPPYPLGGSASPSSPFVPQVFEPKPDPKLTVAQQLAQIQVPNLS